EVIRISCPAISSTCASSPATSPRYLLVDRGELDPLLVGGDRHLELVEEPGEPQQPERGGPRLAEPHWSPPFVCVLAIADEQAHLGHARLDAGTPNREERLGGCRHVDPAQP